MKKIIAAFDGLDFSQSTLSYATFIAKHMKAHLVGVFLDDITRVSFSVSEVASQEGSFDQNLGIMRQHDNALRDKAVGIFESECRFQGIEHSIHRDRNVALQELLHESIYADLIIVEKSQSLTRHEEPYPSRFVRELLSDVQCPVLVVPPVFTFIQRVELLYDGEPSSVHAIKMFQYLFSEIGFKETEVLSVRPEDESLHLPDNYLMKDFMKRHFPAAEYVVMKGFAEDKILSYLAHKDNDILIVLGAYRRSRVSRWFRESMADVLMKYLNMPLFIAPNK